MSPILETEEWRSQPEHWMCPACLRRKGDCEIPKGDGNTLRWLVQHHDHMADYVKAYIKKRFGGYAGFCAGLPLKRESQHFVDRLKLFAKRFDDVVVCLDCNEVEGKIKTKIGADRYFTFHAHEIRRAFVPIPNERHVFLSEHMGFYARFYEAHADRLVGRRKRVLERLVDQAHEEQSIWGNAVEATGLFTEHELQVVYPIFDSGTRISQALREGQPVMQGAAWTASNDEQLQALLQMGESVGAVAKKMGRTAAGIRFRVQHLAGSKTET